MLGFAALGSLEFIDPGNVSTRIFQLWQTHIGSLELTFFFPFQLQVQNGPLGHRGEGEPGGIPMPVVLVPLFALTMLAAWAFMRYRQQL